MSEQSRIQDEPRQPTVRPADLSAEQAALYESIVGGPRGSGPFALTDEHGVLQGPFGGFLMAPAFGEALQHLGAVIRYRSRLTPRVREIAILVVASHHQSAFERYAHEAVGAAIGLAAAEMAAIAGDADPMLTDPAERAALVLTRALLAGDVDDATWHECRSYFEPGVMYELLVLVGYYSTLALQMRVLRTDTAPS